MDQFLKYVEYFSFTLAGGIIGYFIRLFIEHRLAIDRIKENIRITEFNKASAVFRANFVDEIFHLRRNVEPFAERFGERREDIEIANEKAKIIFEAFLPQKELVGFKAAWEQYKNPKEESNIKESPLGPEYYKELGQIRLSHINHLLEYAKPKL